MAERAERGQWVVNITGHAEVDPRTLGGIRSTRKFTGTGCRGGSVPAAVWVAQVGDSEPRHGPCPSAVMSVWSWPFVVNDGPGGLRGHSRKR